MPLVAVPGVGNIQFPDGMQPEQIARAIQQDILPKYGVPQPQHGFLETGWQRAKEQVLASPSDWSAGASVLNPWADAPTITPGDPSPIQQAHLEDIFSKPRQVAGELAGSGIGGTLPSLAAELGGAGIGTLAGGILGGPPGALAGRYIGGAIGGGLVAGPLNAGDTYQQLIEEGVDHDRAKTIASVISIPITALDMASLRVMHQALRGVSGLAAKAIGKVIGGKDVSEQAAKELGKGVLSQRFGAFVDSHPILSAMGMEGVTEGAQQAMQEGTAAYASDTPFFTGERMRNIAEAGLAGGIGGGVFGGIGALHRPEDAARPTPQPEIAPLTTPEIDTVDRQRMYDGLDKAGMPTPQSPLALPYFQRDEVTSPDSPAEQPIPQVEEAKTTTKTESPIGTFGKPELGKELTKQVDKVRRESGLPQLTDYTIEDVTQAGASRDDIDRLLAIRTNFNPKVKVSEDAILKAAGEKNIVRSDDGWKNFLRTVTGWPDISTLSQPQRQAVLHALDGMERFPSLTSLPVTTAASNFSMPQLFKARNAIRVQGSTSLQTIMNATGLRNKNDAETLRQELVRRGELVPSEDIGGRPVYLTQDEAKEAGKVSIASPEATQEVERGSGIPGYQLVPTSAPAEQQGGMRGGVSLYQVQEEAGKPRKRNLVGTFADERSAMDSAISGLGDDQIASLATPQDGAGIRQQLAAKMAQDEQARRSGLIAPKGGIATVAVPEGSTPDEVRARIKEVVKTKPVTAKPDVQAKLAGLEATLRKRLDRLGLKDVKLNLVSSLNGIAGNYQAKLITIALDNKLGYLRTLDHEAVHAIRDMGVISQRDWGILKRKIDSDGLLTKPFGPFKRATNERYPGLKGDALYEEAVADMFAAHNRGDLAYPGFFASLSNKVKNFFEALRNALHGQGLRTADDVFESLNAGTTEVEKAPDTAEPAIDKVEPPVEPPVPEPVLASSEALVQNSVADNIADTLGKKYPELATSYREFVKPMGKRDDIIRLLQDRMVPVKRLQEYIEKRGGTVAEAFNPYLKEELFHGIVGDRIEKAEATLYNPLLEAIKSSKVPFKAFEDWLAARHAPERNAYLKAKFGFADGSGYSDADAKTLRDKLEAEHDAGVLNELGAKFDAIIEDTNTSRQKGFLTQVFDPSAGFKHYAPMRSFEEDPDGKPPPAWTKTGLLGDVRGAEDSAMKGRSTKPEHIIAAAILQNEMAHIRAERNVVGKAFLDMIRENDWTDEAKVSETNDENAQKWVVDEDGAIRTYRAGYYTDPNTLVVKEADPANPGKIREVAVQIKDNRVANAIKGVTPQGMEATGALVKGLGLVNRWLSQVNTGMNPEFLVANLLKDLQEAGIRLEGTDYTGMQKQLVTQIPSAVKGIWYVLRNDARAATDPWSQTFREMSAAGGRTYFLGIKDIGTKVKDIQKMVDGMEAKDGNSVQNTMMSIYNLVEDLNGVFENATRLSVYKIAKDSGATEPKAASLAKNITVNFTRGGELKTLMNSMYLFYNASLQGSMALVNSMKSKRVQKIAAGIVIGGMVMDAMNRALSPPDDDGENAYDKIVRGKPWVGEHNLMVMIPGSKEYVTLPMPYGFNAFYNFGRNLSAMMAGAVKPTTAAKSMLMVGVDAFNPLGGSDSFIKMVSPTITDPIVDLATNTNYAGKKIVPDQDPFSPYKKPDSQLYWSNTWPPYVKVSEWVNKLTGGTTAVPGAVDISPETSKYWIDYVLGGTGKFVERAARGTFDAATGNFEDIEIGQVPWLRRVVGSLDKTANTEAYYERATEVLTAKAELKQAIETHDQDRMKEAITTYGKQLSVAGVFERADQQLAKLRHEKMAARRDDAMPEAAKKMVIENLDKRMDFLISNVNRVYNNVVSAKGV